MSEQELSDKVLAARGMVANLCLPKGTEGARDWMMSIPVRSDYDPDIVIIDALDAQDERIAALEREREVLRGALTDAEWVLRRFPEQARLVADGDVRKSTMKAICLIRKGSAAHRMVRAALAAEQPATPTGADSSAGKAARHKDGDSNDEEAPSNKAREAFAWLYQWAGAMRAPAFILDNLSALSSGEVPPHEWAYPTPIPDEQAQQRSEDIRKLVGAARVKLADCKENGDCSDAALMDGECCSDECGALQEALKPFAAEGAGESAKEP